jgi:NAD(P)-dependent dehydrogenase (short-subunit alcohol dehydrogenase family)
MSTVLVTGSADGLGRLSAGRLVALGHDVVLHARDDGRADDALAAVPGARTALAGDLASIEQTRALADAANAAGPFDAVIHNAAVGYREQRIETVDGLEHVFAVNVLAPYLLTALIARPRRLVYLSSGMHTGGELVLDDLQWARRRANWSGTQAYSDSKLMDAMLAFAVARLWPDVSSNAVTPGWVATKMGGAGAPDDLEAGAETQVWLAVSDDPDATATGRYLYHRRPRDHHPAVGDPDAQDALLAALEKISGVGLPV